MRVETFPGMALDGADTSDGGASGAARSLRRELRSRVFSKAGDCELAAAALAIDVARLRLPLPPPPLRDFYRRRSSLALLAVSSSEVCASLLSLDRRRARALLEATELSHSRADF